MTTKWVKRQPVRPGGERARGWDLVDSDGNVLGWITPTDYKAWKITVPGLPRQRFNVHFQWKGIEFFPGYMQEATYPGTGTKAKAQRVIEHVHEVMVRENIANASSWKSELRNE